MQPSFHRSYLLLLRSLEQLDHQIGAAETWCSYREARRAAASAGQVSRYYSSAGLVCHVHTSTILI